MRKIAIMIIAIAFTASLAGCCGGGSSSSSNGSDSTSTIKQDGKNTVYENVSETKFSGTAYNNNYAMDVRAGGTTYRVFNTGSGGVFVVNVTLDSLQELAVKKELGIDTED